MPLNAQYSNRRYQDMIEEIHEEVTCPVGKLGCT